MEQMSRKRERGHGGALEDTAKEKKELEALFFRNLVDPDFEELARQAPVFGAAWRRVVEQAALHRSGPAQLTPECSVALCQALLRVHFGISLSHVPFFEGEDNDEEAHLCPPIPNRYFYVRWIHQDLLPIGRDASYFMQQPVSNETETVSTTVGLDIGTGAICIYPLLTVTSLQKFIPGDCVFMYATDIDPQSVRLAQANVNANPQWKNKICVCHVPASDQQLQSDELVHTTLTDETTMQVDSLPSASASEANALLFPIGPLRRSVELVMLESSSPSPLPTTPVLLDFVMTNPPFFDIAEFNSISSSNGRRRQDSHRRHDRRHRTLNQQHQPQTLTPMTQNEGCYPGGEVGFGLDMLVDGLYLDLLQSNLNLSDADGKKPLLATDLAARHPPIWTSSMIGKKSSFVRLHHIVTQLLGPAHVCSTEFGPGHLTRWFLAWTFQRPTIRSPLANRLTWTFSVPASSLLHTNSLAASPPMHTSATNEVVGRICEYSRAVNMDCAIQNDEGGINGNIANNSLSMNLQIVESSIAPPPWKDDDEMPESIQRILKNEMSAGARMGFLPLEGHYLMDVMVTIIDDGASVRILAYFHSTYGRKVIEKFKSQLESEVCRTNRRWRRALQRSQDAQNLERGFPRQDDAMDDFS